MRIRLAQSEEDRSKSYQMRYKVMCEELNWIPRGGFAVPEERDKYDDSQSITFMSFDDTNNAIGTSRLLTQGKISLPIENEFELSPISEIEKRCGTLRSYVEVSRFIVPPNKKYKKHEITLLLCDTMIDYCIQSNMSHMLLSADYRFFRLLRMIGYPVSQIGKPAFYMGSKTVPGILTLSEVNLKHKVQKAA